jgi:hypothetical protein
MTHKFEADLAETIDDMNIVTDDHGNVVIARESWAELQKAIDGDPGDPDENSQVALDSFFAGLLQSFTQAINGTLRSQGRALQAGQEKVLYSGTPGLAVDFANAINAMSKLSPAELAKAKSLGPLYDLDVPTPVAKRAMTEIEQDMKRSDRKDDREYSDDDLALFERVANSAKRSFFKNLLAGGPGPRD